MDSSAIVCAVNTIAALLCIYLLIGFVVAVSFDGDADAKVGWGGVALECMTTRYDRGGAVIVMLLWPVVLLVWSVLTLAFIVYLVFLMIIIVITLMRQ